MSFLTGVTIFALGLRFNLSLDLASLAPLLLAPGISYFYRVALIVLVFPAIVFAGAKPDPANAAMTRICAALGKTSYVLSVVHVPFYSLSYGLILKLFPEGAARFGAWVGVGLLTLAVILSWALATWYEPKARAAFERVFGGRATPRIPAG